MTNCATCGAAKPKDRFKNCSSCRKAWRLSQRKPTGWATKIELLEAKVKQLEEKLKQKDQKYVK